MFSDTIVIWQFVFFLQVCRTEAYHERFFQIPQSFTSDQKRLMGKMYNKMKLMSVMFTKYVAPLTLH